MLTHSLREAAFLTLKYTINIESCLNGLNTAHDLSCAMASSQGSCHGEQLSLLHCHEACTAGCRAVASPVAGCIPTGAVPVHPPGLLAVLQEGADGRESPAAHLLLLRLPGPCRTEAAQLASSITTHSQDRPAPAAALQIDSHIFAQRGDTALTRGHRRQAAFVR